MARIPMKDDPPTLEQIVEKYGDPLGKLEEIRAQNEAELTKAREMGEPGVVRSLERLQVRIDELLGDYRRGQ